MQNAERRQTCRLCGALSDLKKSHVFPEFLYKPSYDNIHRAIRFDIDNSRRSFLQKGIRDRLLCGACEQHLSKIERQFKVSWYDGNRLPQKVTDEFLRLKGFDYVQFKLFHLSILWRCSVATIADFSTVNLGRHENHIACMIRNEVAGEEGTYRFWGQVLVYDDNRIVHDHVSRPQASRLDGHHVYYACYGGCEWTFLVSSHSSAKYKDQCFREDGSIILRRVPIRQCNSMRIFAEQLQSR